MHRILVVGRISADIDLLSIIVYDICLLVIYPDIYIYIYIYIHIFIYFFFIGNEPPQ